MKPARVRQLVTFTTVVLAASATSPAAAEPAIKYVALGDSFTSGPLIPLQESLICTRSTQNYPHLVAAAIGASLTDVSCGGAVIENLAGTQFGIVPPQFDALRPDTDLVTVSVGGNDIGFGEIVATCGVMGALHAFGQPCTDFYTRGGVDQIAGRLAALQPELVAVVEAIQARSPQARILVVGVPSVLPSAGSCWGLNIPIAPGDYPYLIQINKALNATYAAAAAEAGAEFVDIFTRSVGHDVCQPIGTKWVEGVIPNDFAAPVHPNKRGMQGAAQDVLDALQ